MFNIELLADPRASVRPKRLAPNGEDFLYPVPPGVRVRSDRVGHDHARRILHHKPSPRCVCAHCYTVSALLILSLLTAAASDVENEPLEPEFSGILGLALPLNSIIAQQIPPVTSNAPDGAAWASNLFSITPTNEAPSARFLSLSLSRPGSNTVPALLGIGRHPAALVPDPSKIQYAGLVSDRNGVLFWKASVRAITVYVNGVPKPVSLGPSVSGGAFPSAVLDSGVPLILTTSPVANAIYGAIGVTPSSDGNCAFFSFSELVLVSGTDLTYWHAQTTYPATPH